MDTHIIYTTGIILIISQLLFMVMLKRNTRYVFKKFARDIEGYTPKTLLTIPCKGLDVGFEENMKSFLLLDYDNYGINFVVESETDEAFDVLTCLKEKWQQQSKAKQIDILIAGITPAGSQKNHNLLHSLEHNGNDFDVFAFADSDARVNNNWLKHLVYPLRKPIAGASSGYRWILPAENNLPSILLSTLNAKVAQFLGKSVWNQAWGGSMAIRKDTFYSLGLDKTWRSCISDDLSLTYAVKKSKLKLRFALGAMAATYEETSFGRLAEFARRQFIITRKTVLTIWLLGIISCLYSIVGVWGCLILGLCKLSSRPAEAAVMLATSAVFIVCQMLRVATRKKIADKVLNLNENNADQSRVLVFIAIATSSIFMLIFLLSSAFGSEIVWRGKRYNIINATQTQLID